MYKNNSERLIFLDVYRVVCVLAIFLFHSNLHIGVTYGVFTTFISMGSVMMTAFFVLSGFSLYYVYREKAFNEVTEIYSFYKKRCVKIFPAYLFVVLFFPVLSIYLGNPAVKELVTIPIEFLGLQSIFHSILSISHNSATWFITCFIVCYFIFPLVLNLVRKLNIKRRIISMIFLNCLLIYASFAVAYFQIESIYNNTFFRVIEFIIGMIICSIYIEKKKAGHNSLGISIITIIIFIGTITSLGIKIPLYKGYIQYSPIGIPFFTVLFLVIPQNIRFYSWIETVIKYFSEISYCFILAQIFSWSIVIDFVSGHSLNSNIILFTISFIVCCLISICLHEFLEKPIQKVLSNKFY